MKKFFSLLLVMALLFSMALPAGAAIISELTYSDAASGNKLTYPSSWNVVNKTNELYKVKFELKSGSSPVMQYGSADLYSQLDAETKELLTRADFCNDQFSKAEIAELLDTSAKNVKMTTLGKEEYFFIQTEYTKNVSGLSLTLDTHYWVLIKNGWFYIYQFGGSEKHDLYDDFTKVIASAAYGSRSTLPTFSPKISGVSTYDQAVKYYNNGEYSKALEKFKSCPNEKDSQKYIRLINIRSYGENTGIGCVYDYRKALTAEEKAEIDKAAKDFYFADTAQVLLCNTDVATYYLFGNWNTAAGVTPYSYLRFHKDSAGGYYYTRSNNLSTAVSDCVSIIDGDVRLSITSSNTLTFHIELTAPDCMEIYSYQYCKSYTLYRQ